MYTNNWNILGHEWAVDLLKGHLANGRIRHAYLFTGPQGVGRRTLALRLAQAINCEQPTEPGTPCGTCRACRLIEKMQHPDLTVVQSDTVGGNLKVDQIREVQHSLALSPYEAQYRVALILRFEEANPNAANALLKTLEEPPPRVVMMLTAQDPESLLPTIVSRCELIRLRPLGIDQVSEGLQTRYGLPTENAELLAHLSGGRPGYALRLHENPELLESRQACLCDLRGLLSANRVERYDYVENLVKDRLRTENVLQVWTSFWRDVMLLAAGSSAPLTNLDQKPEIEAAAKKIDLATAQGMVQCLERTQSQFRRYINPRLTLEVLMLDLPRI